MHRVNLVEPGYVNNHKNSIYPFDQLDYGESFWVPFADVKENSMRKNVYHHNTRYKKMNVPKVFKMITHNAAGGWEIGRIL